MKRLRRLVVLGLVCGLIWQGWQLVSHINRVLAYRPLVQDLLREQSSFQDDDLILAMIYTESKGQGLDIMQASESQSGLPNAITSPRESLEEGIRLLMINLEEVDRQGVDFWTAIQAYNFGTPYIAFVAEQGGTSNLDLASRYSREVLAPSLGNVTGVTYPYYHPLALIHASPSLYYNGGNRYYAQEVFLNLYLIKLGKLWENL